VMPNMNRMIAVRIRAVLMFLRASRRVIMGSRAVYR
jgi:hypothetical protein